MARSSGTRIVSATYAAKNFGELADRVRESAAPFIIERSGVPIAEIRPAARTATRRGLAELLASVTPGDDAFGRAVRAGQARSNRPAVPRATWGR